MKVIFWDFDGVIKDSVEVKSDAFEKLFSSFGLEVAKRVRKHHEANGGVSRYDKIPLYLSWAGEEVSEQNIEYFCNQFSVLVKQAVVDSSWVACVQQYLEKHHADKLFFLVSATPQQEIVDILASLEIAHYFQEVHGSPTKKGSAIKSILQKYEILLEQSMMIGDSLSDYEAAVSNHVPFVLRRTSLNADLQKKLDCIMIDNFCLWID